MQVVVDARERLTHDLDIVFRNLVRRNATDHRFFIRPALEQRIQMVEQQIHYFADERPGGRNERGECLDRDFAECDESRQRIGRQRRIDDIRNRDGRRLVLLDLRPDFAELHFETGNQQVVFVEGMNGQAGISPETRCDGA
ncbi:hypothetical protein [Burkholderia sp. BCC0419]|uniref:hypothetical protein n=1 Tax=Burkholderia sp. BCC0419 TaxID=486878 RepID=UPI00158D65D8|nr:hypothetical protein [Burkholderia sp. BCC0419]